GDAGILQHVDGVRRLGIDHGHEPGRYLIIAAAEDDGGRIGKADLCRAGGDLLDRIRGALPAYYRNFEIALGVVAFLKRDEVIGVAAVVTEVGDEGDLVGSLRAVRRERPCTQRSEDYEEAFSVPAH